MNQAVKDALADAETFWMFVRSTPFREDPAPQWVEWRNAFWFARIRAHNAFLAVPDLRKGR